MTAVQPGLPGMTLDRRESLVAIDAFLDVHGSAAKPSNTRRTYSTVMRQWMDWCTEHGVHLVQPTAGECTAFRDHVAERGSVSTVSQRCLAVRSMIQHAIDTGRVPGPNPWASVKLPRRPKKSTTKSLTAEQQRRLNRWCAEHGSARTHALVRLMGVLGMRISEALAFDMNHLTLNTSTEQWEYRFVAKGGVERVITVDDRTVDAIQAQFRVTCADNKAVAKEAASRKPGDPCYLFPGRSPGTTLHYATAVADIDKACIGAGVPRTGPHGFRHAAITRTLDATGDIRIAQELAGHATVDSTIRYDRRNDLQQRGVAAIVNVLDEGDMA